MKVTVCQLDNRADSLEPMLDDLGRHIAAEKSEFLLLPEMCFHEWLAADRKPDGKRWMAAVESHAEQILQLGKLGARADCGGLGWIFSPEGDVMAQTDAHNPFTSLEIDIEFSRHSKSTYPRYVAE